MGRKGWAGAPPSDDAEARQRIIDAARHCLQRAGGQAQPTLSEVAETLGITRRTVYRYFASTEELLSEVADVALRGFVDEIADRIAHLAATDQLVEVVAHIIERLPHQSELTLLVANDHSHQFSRRMLGPDVIQRCREILLRTDIDWAALGYDEHLIDDLIEFLLRIIQSMIVAPRNPPRTPTELRAFLRRWVTPALLTAPR